jgi:hypothetical protein
MSPFGAIVVNDHGHHHDGDECQIELRPSVAPKVPAVVAALRRQGLVRGSGRAGEFGATVFTRGETQIFIRYDVAEEATGVTEDKAGLTLLIQRPAG